MSHFRVLVVTDTLRETMARYNEQDERFFTEHELLADTLLNKFKTEKKNEEFRKFAKDKVNRYAYGTSDLFELFCMWWYRMRVAHNEKQHTEFAEQLIPHVLMVDGKAEKGFRYYNSNAQYDYYNDVAHNSFCYDWYKDIVYKDGNKDNCTIGNIDIDKMGLNDAELDVDSIVTEKDGWIRLFNNADLKAIVKRLAEENPKMHFNVCDCHI